MIPKHHWVFAAKTYAKTTPSESYQQTQPPGQEEMFCTISLNKRFVLEDLLNVLKKHSNYLFLRDFDITDEFSQVGVIINFKNSKDINSLSTELNRTYSGVNIKFLNKQALG